MRALAPRYLAFVHAAFDPTRARFRNFMSYVARWTEQVGSEDSHGRARLGPRHGRRARRTGPGAELASELFHAALPARVDFTSPRAWASTLLGIDEYLRAFEGDRRCRGRSAATSPIGCSTPSRGRSRPTGRGSRTELTYCNAQLPQALIVSGARMGRADLVDGRPALARRGWSACSGPPDGRFAPIGSNGFAARGGDAARFDQQPIEACDDGVRVPRGRSA